MRKREKIEMYIDSLTLGVPINLPNNTYEKLLEMKNNEETVSDVIARLLR